MSAKDYTGEPIMCPDCGGTGSHPWLQAFCRTCGGSGEITPDINDPRFVFCEDGSILG